EVGADGAHGLGELLQRGGHAARARGQQDHGVVGGHAGVGVDPVEGGRGGGAQGGIRRGGVDVGIRGEHHEHGRELRGEHPGALGDAAHDGAGGGGGLGGLGDRVGGHDRPGGGLV